MARNSSIGIGSPEQVCGWALCAGRPGPFLVCSFFRHLARKFWNHTCNATRIFVYKYKLLFGLLHKFGIIEKLNVNPTFLNTYCHSALLQVQTHRQRLAHKHVRIVISGKSPLQLFQLPGTEVGSRSASLRRIALVVAVGG